MQRGTPHAWAEVKGELALYNLLSLSKGIELMALTFTTGGGC